MNHTPMKEKSVKVSITEFSSKNDLPKPDQELVEVAFEAAGRAYAPYSGFTVGAALRLRNNQIVSGNNQENAAYPSGLCAERVAMFYASSQYPGQAIETIAVVARADGVDLSEPATPCGSCRQVMAEYEQLHKNSMRVIMATESGKTILVEGMENLLPLAFLGEHLKKG
jgi:cytidine deaminase